MNPVVIRAVMTAPSVRRPRLAIQRAAKKQAASTVASMPIAIFGSLHRPPSHIAYRDRMPKQVMSAGIPRRSVRPLQADATAASSFEASAITSEQIRNRIAPGGTVSIPRLLIGQKNESDVLQWRVPTYSSRNASPSRATTSRGPVMSLLESMVRAQYRGTVSSISFDHRSMPPCMDRTSAKPRCRSRRVMMREREPWWQ